jgi:hypothetical protein
MASRCVSMCSNALERQQWNEPALARQSWIRNLQVYHGSPKIKPLVYIRHDRTQRDGTGPTVCVCSNALAGKQWNEPALARQCWIRNLQVYHGSPKIEPLVYIRHDRKQRDGSWRTGECKKLGCTVHCWLKSNS